MGINIALPLYIFSGGIWQIIGQTGAFGLFILIVLIVMSLISWGIMFNKWRLYKKVEVQNTILISSFRRAKKFSEVFNQANSLRLSPLAGIFVAGYNEIKDLMAIKGNENPAPPEKSPLNSDEISTVEMTLERVAAEEISKLERYIVFLATTANASPFLGLLGTVVGVMNAFWSIGERGSASLAVVAPGIAEALLATIVGLGAAIPAVIGFNWANNKLKIFYDRASNFNLEFLTRVKKELG
jgi:biopolymer transport protein TolQ